MRRFDNGVVLLNPNSKKIKVDLGQSYSTIDGEKLSQFDLPPQRGLILLGKSNQRCNRSSDINHDGRVDIEDYSVLVAHWFGTDPTDKVDLNCDQNVDLDDYSILMTDFAF